MLVHLGWWFVAIFMFWQDGGDGKIRITIDDGKAGGDWPTPFDPCTFTVVASPAEIAAGMITLVVLAAVARRAIAARMTNVIVLVAATLVASIRVTTLAHG